MKQRRFVVYLLLNIVTCGIYGIYFWYVFTENLNQICAEKVPNDKPSMNYILVLLLSIVTCGIFYYFWLYQQGNRMLDASRGYGREFHETGTTYLMWCLFGILLCGIGSLYGTYLVIRNMNTLIGEYGREQGMAVS